MCGWVGPFLLTFAQNLLSKVLGISQLHWLIGDGRVQPRRPSHSKTNKTSAHADGRRLCRCLQGWHVLEARPLGIRAVPKSTASSVIRPTIYRCELQLKAEQI